MNAPETILMLSKDIQGKTAQILKEFDSYRHPIAKEHAKIIEKAVKQLILLTERSAQIELKKEIKNPPDPRMRFYDSPGFHANGAGGSPCIPDVMKAMASHGMV